MSLFKLCVVPACVILVVSTVCAQQNDISIDSKPTPNQILAWLSSGEPRPIAWGAYFAAKSGDDSTTPAMARILEEWRPGDPGSDSAGWSRLGISYVLDALIVRNQRVTPRAIIAITSAFPTESLILLSKLPAGDSTPLLLDRYEERKKDGNSSSPRIAAMLLSKNPPPGFAASILAEMEVNLDVEVVLQGGFGTGGGVSSCGDGGGGAPRVGWPPFFFYITEENSSRADAQTLVSAGGDRISYSRIPESVGWGSCFFPQRLTPETRLHLLAEMLGIRADRMSFQTRENETIVWRDDGQYLRELHDVIAKEERQFDRMATALRERHLLTAEEAEKVRPTLRVTVMDVRYPELPHLKATDARTSITYGRHGGDSPAGSVTHP